MSYNVYLFGAGISADTVPMVSQTPAQVQLLIEELKDVRAQLGDEALGLKPETAAFHANTIIQFAQEFHAIISDKEFPITQDEWAKQLMITDSQKFLQLREFLSIFYTWSQRTRPTCPRIRKWVEDLINPDTKRLPSHSTILTWNYDWQLEAPVNEVTTGRHILDPNPIYGGFFRKSDMRIGEKGLKESIGFKVFKLNGDAFWSHPMMSGNSERTIGHASKDLSTTQFWNGLLNGLRVLKSSPNPEVSAGISFSFHWSDQTKQFFEVIESTIKPARNLVIAGYSLPDANQELDARLFSSMSNLKSIKIYDLPEKEQPLKDAVNFILTNTLDYKPLVQFKSAGEGISNRLPVSKLYGP